MSEAITNQSANGLIIAKSAGSQPAGEVHPLSLKYLAGSGFSTEGLMSQSWYDLESFEPDLVVTVCDSAASEACPVYFGNSLKVHWGLSDPSKIKGDESQIKHAFLACIKEIAQRVNELESIAKQKLSISELKIALAKAGAQ